MTNDLALAALVRWPVVPSEGNADAVIWAFIKEALARSKGNPEQTMRLNKLRELLRWRR